MGDKQNKERSLPLSLSSVCTRTLSTSLRIPLFLPSVKRVIAVLLTLPCDGLGGDVVQLTHKCGVGCLLVGCLTSQQHASVSQRRICSDNCTCCHTEVEAADPTFYLTQSQYTDTGPTSPNADPRTPGAWQGSHWSANV